MYLGDIEGSVPDCGSGVRITIKRVVVFLLVMGHAFKLKKTPNNPAMSVKCSKAKYNKTGYACKFKYFVSTNVTVGFPGSSVKQQQW